MRLVCEDRDYLEIDYYDDCVLLGVYNEAAGDTGECCSMDLSEEEVRLLRKALTAWLSR